MSMNISMVPLVNKYAEFNSRKPQEQELAKSSFLTKALNLSTILLITSVVCATLFGLNAAFVLGFVGLCLRDATEDALKFYTVAFLGEGIEIPDEVTIFGRCFWKGAPMVSSEGQIEGDPVRK